MLPRGLKIVEEEETLEGSPRYFSNYERERSIKRFFNVDLKYNRAHLSHLRTIKKKAHEEYNAIPNDLWSCTEAEFVQNLTRHVIEKYDSTKEKRMEKIKAKIAKGYDSYVSIVFWVDVFLIILIKLMIRCQIDTLQCRVQKLQMASTWSMNVFHMWMEYTQPQHISNKYWIVDPL